jgi:hypothetical protein
MSKKSRWIIIDLSDRKKLIEDAFTQACGHCCPARMGVELLQACVSNWTDYIEYLGSQLRKLVSVTLLRDRAGFLPTYTE